MTTTKYFFVTGTDTGVGKTLVSCALLQAAVRAGYRAIGYKPVATGCKYTFHGPQNTDALALMANSNVNLAYDQVNPLAFITPTSPHIASYYEGRYISVDIISTGLKSLASITDWLIIEGVGGWFTPLNEKLTIGDWVASEQLPVIVVVSMKLGCLNHALLTTLAICQAGLKLSGWIANHSVPTIDYWLQDYLKTLQQRICAPMLGEIPWLYLSNNTPLADYLDLSYLV